MCIILVFIKRPHSTGSVIFLSLPWSHTSHQSGSVRRAVNGCVKCYVNIHNCRRCVSVAVPPCIVGVGRSTGAIHFPIRHCLHILAGHFSSSHSHGLDPWILPLHVFCGLDWPNATVDSVGQSLKNTQDICHQKIDKYSKFMHPITLAKILTVMYAYGCHLFIACSWVPPPYRDHLNTVGGWPWTESTFDAQDQLDTQHILYVIVRTLLLASYVYMYKENTWKPLWLSLWLLQDALFLYAEMSCYCGESKRWSGVILFIIHHVVILIKYRDFEPSLSWSVSNKWIISYVCGFLHGVTHRTDLISLCVGFYMW